MKPHKHAELIKAWADGAEVQHKYNGEWEDTDRPQWIINAQYRIRPKPDYEETVTLFRNSAVGFLTPDVEPRWLLNAAYYKSFGNFKITWDGETGKLKSAEVLK